MGFKFGVADYVVCTIFVVISMACGIYFAYKSRHRRSGYDYMLGSQSLKAIPVSLSLLTSTWSAIALLGYPSEFYFYGTQFYVILIGNLLSSALTAFVFVPKYRALNLHSLYEYLELRFDKSVKMGASITFLIQTALYLAVVIYAPALALQQVTALNSWISLFGLTVVCIIYSTLGGLRGIVWSDVFQATVIFVGLLLTIIFGATKVGGLNRVFRLAKDTDRLEFFAYSFDPRVRHTIWSLSIGAGFTTLGVFSFNQMLVQRHLSVSTDRMAKQAIWLNFVGVCIYTTICGLIGLVMFAYYYQCDPYLQKRINATDQLYPLFIVETMQNIPGLSGLFISTIFSGTLSTVSSCLNAMSGVIVDEFIKVIFDRFEIKVKNWTPILQIITVMMGIVGLSLTFLVRYVPFVLQAAFSIFGVYHGPVMGVFFVGFFLPFVTAVPALIGLIVSLCYQSWILFGSIIFAKLIQSPMKPLDTSSCNTTELRNMTINLVTDTKGIIAFYGLGYQWNALSGTLACVLVSLIAHCIYELTFRRNKPKVHVDQKLLLKLPSCKKVGKNEVDANELAPMEN